MKISITEKEAIELYGETDRTKSGICQNCKHDSFKIKSNKDKVVTIRCTHCLFVYDHSTLPFDLFWEEKK